MSESNESLEKLIADYNEAISYIEFVKTDGSLGMHNSERTEEELAKAEIILRSITGEENPDIEVEDVEIAGKEEQNENTVVGTGIADLFLIISLTATVMAMSKKKRGK
jgi:hypothetical protein